MRYKLLGKSGLKVSELCLGAMTFGDDWGWGFTKMKAAKSMMPLWKPAAISSTLPGSLCRAQRPHNCRSICWAAAEADIQFTIFDSSALKKQLLIFLNREP